MPATDSSPAYPHISAKMWRDGYRYVMIQANQYANRIPRWFDRAGFEEAGLLALMAAAKTYDAQKGAWSTYLHRACRCHFEREYRAQVNWQHGMPPYGNDLGPIEPATSLDTPVGWMERRQRLADLIPGGEDPAVNVERLEVRQAFSRLDDADAQVLQGRQDGWSLRELGAQFDRSGEWIRQRENAALAQLRALLTH